MNDRELMKRIYDRDCADELSAEEILSKAGRGVHVRSGYMGVIAAAVICIIAVGGFFWIRNVSAEKVNVGTDKEASSAEISQPVSDTNSRSFQILRENLAEVNVFRRTEFGSQKILLPLVANEKNNTVNVKKINGENIDSEAITCTIDYLSDLTFIYWNTYVSNYDEYPFQKHLYQITLEIDWNKYKYSDEVRLDSLTLEVDSKEYIYDFGTAVIRSEEIAVPKSPVLISSMFESGGEPRLFDMKLEFDETVEIKAIKTTLDLPLKNEAMYLREYDKGSEVKIGIDIDQDAAALDKFFYIYDVYIEYEYNGAVYRCCYPEPLYINNTYSPHI